MKKCIKCKQTKPETAFKKHYEKGKITLRNVCKECYNEYRRNDHSHQCNDKLDLLTKYLDACDYHPEEVGTISKEKFIRTFHIDDPSFSMEELEEQALIKLHELGYDNPKTLTLQEEGSYLVVGDTFGKKTCTEKFKLLANIVKTYKIKKVIAIGHNTDDYNDVSNAFPTLGVEVIFIPMKNELHDINEFCQDYPNMSIVQDEVNICDINIKNQDYITPYVKTSLSSIDPLLYPGKVITNCTRHELYSRATTNGESFICSPGAMAEPHVVRVIYKLMLASGGRINVTPCSRNSFTKYRKNEVDKLLWEMGCIVVHVNSVGITDVELIRIKSDLSCVLRRGYFVTPERVSKIKPSVAILSDVHIPNASCLFDILYDLRRFNPEQILINGDLFDMRAFNPHEHHTDPQYDFDTEYEDVLTYLKDLSRIAPVDIMWGNHEMFANRFFKQYPLLKDFFMKRIKEGIYKYAQIVTNNPSEAHYVCGRLPVFHGSADIYGANGSIIEKVARCTGEAIIGHTHSPAIRFGVYCAGCCCAFNQGYNNSTTTNWRHGYLLVYKINDQVYIHQVAL